MSICKNEGGKRLRSWRIAQGINQTELAYKLGITQAMVSTFERGSVRPGVTVAIRIQVLTAVAVTEWYPDVVAEAMRRAA